MHIVDAIPKALAGIERELQALGYSPSIQPEGDGWRITARFGLGEISSVVEIDPRGRIGQKAQRRAAYQLHEAHVRAEAKRLGLLANAFEAGKLAAYSAANPLGYDDRIGLTEAGKAILGLQTPEEFRA